MGSQVILLFCNEGGCSASLLGTQVTLLASPLVMNSLISMFTVSSKPSVTCGFSLSRHSKASDQTRQDVHACLSLLLAPLPILLFLSCSNWVHSI